MTCPHCDWAANLKSAQAAAFGRCPRCMEKSDRQHYTSGSKAMPILVRRPLVCGRCLSEMAVRNQQGMILGRGYRMDDPSASSAALEALKQAFKNPEARHGNS